MPLVDISGDGDDGVEHVMNMVGFSKPILDKGRQVLPISDELVIIAQPHSTCMLFEQRCVVLHHLSALPQLFKRHECITGLVDHFKSCVESSDKC